MLGSVITAMVTPFRADGAVDFERFRELATFLVENGSDGIVVCGTTGESPTLSDGEKLDLFRVAVDEVGGRATVIAGTGTYDTAHSAALTREATDLGVGGIFIHHRDIRLSADIAIIIRTMRSASVSRI